MIDLTELSEEKALETLLEKAHVYVDTTGKTEKLKSVWDVDMLGTQFRELIENVGTDKVFIYSIYDGEGCTVLKKGNRWANIIARFALAEDFLFEEIDL